MVVQVTDNSSSGAGEAQAEGSASCCEPPGSCLTASASASSTSSGSLQVDLSSCSIGNGHSNNPIHQSQAGHDDFLDSTDSEGSHSGCCGGLGRGPRRTSSSFLHGPHEALYQSLTEKIESRIESGEHFFSLEFFPPRTKSGAVNLLQRWVAVQIFKLQLDSSKIWFSKHQNNKMYCCQPIKLTAVRSN